MITTENISILNLDHPGAHDPVYRARRDQIAEAALNYRNKGEIARVDYTQQENDTWQLISQKLAPLHQAKACRIYLDGKEKLGISSSKIPEFEDLNRQLAPFTGFKVAPIEGLVDSRSFLTHFTERTMLCTQYIRHHSRPEYTPEPDIVHEVLGHVPAFTNEGFVTFMERVGQAAAQATDEELQQLDRVYWWTVEYGLIREGNETKAFGAGLLGSFGEMEHAFEVPHLPFDTLTCMDTEFDYAHMQPQLFVIDSFEALLEQTDAFLSELIGRA